MSILFNLQEALDLPEPAFSNLWLCEDIIHPKGLPHFDHKRYVHSVSVTHPFFNPSTAFRHGKSNYYAGNYDTNSITLNLYEDKDYSTHKFLCAWRNAICDPNTFAYSLPVQYKGFLKVTMLTGIDDSKLSVAMSSSDSEDLGSNLATNIERSVRKFKQFSEALQSQNQSIQHILDMGNRRSDKGTGLSTDGNVAMSIIFAGVFPTSQSPTDLDFGRAERIIVPVEFSVDQVLYEDGSGNQL